MWQGVPIGVSRSGGELRASIGDGGNATADRVDPTEQRMAGRQNDADPLFSQLREGNDWCKRGGRGFL